MGGRPETSGREVRLERAAPRSPAVKTLKVIRTHERERAVGQDHERRTREGGATQGIEDLEEVKPRRGSGAAGG
jgi:hypothetical protein